MKLSKIITKQSPNQGFPIIGVDGYGGEQDGSYVILSDVMHFRSKKDANIEIPEYVKLHWATYRPGYGWDVVIGCWSDMCRQEAYGK